MRTPFAILLLLGYSLATFAQEGKPVADTKLKVTGRVIDSLSHQPLQYATISIVKQKDPKPSSGGMTSAKGGFSLDALTPGTYMLTVDIIGYAPRTIGPITLDGRTSSLSLGDIAVGKKANEMQAVTVTATRGLVENKLDKMVYNVEKDVTSLGGVATDVLKKVPMVSVDVDGNVDIMGNTNILFLINGRPSSIFGNNLADALQSIPASQIKSIEVITSPGAKYDAEGTGGIINIILKDNRLNGINGNLSATAGSRLENGSFNLNARHDNFGLNAFFSGNAQLPSTTHNSSTRYSYDSVGNETAGLFERDGSSRFYRNGFESGLGLEWDINKQNTLSANAGYDNFGNHSRGSYQQEQTAYADPGGNIIQDQFGLVNTKSGFRAHSVDWSLDYKKTFAKDDQELDITVDGSEGNNNSSYGQAQSLPSGDSTYAGSQGSSLGHDHSAHFHLDYTQPFGEKVKLETGGTIQIRDISANSPVYTFDPATGLYPYDTSQSNSLTYDRRVYAGYASLTFPAFHFLDVKGGLRYERTETSAGFSKAEGTSIPGYNTLAPSLILSHKFAGEQSLKLSYVRRIQRPDYRSLNPYVNASDPKNLTRGNPFLQPEIANNIDLTYSKSFDKGSALNVVLFYRVSTQDIQPFLQYYPSYILGDSTYTDVSISTPMNVGAETNIGVNVYGSVPLGNKLSLRSNVSVFNRHITTGDLGAQQHPGPRIFRQLQFGAQRDPGPLPFLYLL
jgi:ferric enterobactin receptor